MKYEIEFIAMVVEADSEDEAIDKVTNKIESGDWDIFSVTQIKGSADNNSNDESSGDTILGDI